MVSVHDVAPATADQTRLWCQDVDSFGIPVSLLVIPGPWRGQSLADVPSYGEVLRARVAGGDELVLHGWTHRAGPEGSRLRRAVGFAVARGAAEFGALDEAQATERLGAGLVAWGARWGTRRRGLVRIALHPDDRRRPGLRDTTMRTIEAVLAAGGRATTYAGAVAR